MKRFLPIIIIFVLIFGLSTNKSFAVDTDNSANIETASLIETQALTPRALINWWNNLVHWKDHFKNYFAKKYKLDVDRKEIVTSYSTAADVTADVSTRAISEITRDELKMEYLKGALEIPPKYDGTIVLATCENSKNAVTIKDLAEYKINLTTPTKGSIACYEKIYIETYTVPQGEKLYEDRKNININKVVRTPIPDEYQLPTPDPIKTKDYESDTINHTNIFYENMLPSDSQPDKKGRLPEVFGQWLRPQNEQ